VKRKKEEGSGPRGRRGKELFSVYLKAAVTLGGGTVSNKSQGTAGRE